MLIGACKADTPNEQNLKIVIADMLKLSLRRCLISISEGVSSVRGFINVDIKLFCFLHGKVFSTLLWCKMNKTLENNLQG